jgi:hypothetical protein
LVSFRACLWRIRRALFRFTRLTRRCFEGAPNLGYSSSLRFRRPYAFISTSYVCIIADLLPNVNLLPKIIIGSSSRSPQIIRTRKRSLPIRTCCPVARTWYALRLSFRQTKPPSSNSMPSSNSKKYRTATSALGLSLLLYIYII